MAFFLLFFFAKNLGDTFCLFMLVFFLSLWLMSLEGIYSFWSWIFFRSVRQGENPFFMASRPKVTFFSVLSYWFFLDLWGIKRIRRLLIALDWAGGRGRGGGVLSGVVVVVC
jgi:hypothetical protein